MALNSDTARPLTSREIAKILAGTLDSLATWCRPTDLVDAIEHLWEHLPKYEQLWEVVHAQKSPTPDDLAKVNEVLGAILGTKPASRG